MIKKISINGMSFTWALFIFTLWLSFTIVVFFTNYRHGLGFYLNFNRLVSIGFSIVVLACFKLALKPMVILNKNEIIYFPPYQLKSRRFTWSEIEQCVTERQIRSIYSKIYIRGENTPISINAECKNYLIFLKYIFKKIGRNKVDRETIEIINNKNSKYILGKLEQESKIAVYGFIILAISIFFILIFLPIQN